jgi:hypothetical protein
MEMRPLTCQDVFDNVMHPSQGIVASQMNKNGLFVLDILERVGRE